MKTTKDILKETLGSLNFPDAAWDELAEKIDNNKKTTLEKIQEIAEDEPSPWLEEAKERRLENIFLANSEWNVERGCKVMTFDEFKIAVDVPGIDKFSEGYGQGLEHGDTQAKIDTPNDIKEFVGKARYDDHGQMIFREPEKNNLQMFLDVRGWGAIQHMGFKTELDAMNFQDKVGRWVTDVINNNLK